MSPSTGPWTVESRKGDRGDPDYYVVLDANGRVIMDTLNSEVALIDDEYGPNGSHYQWDEQGRVNCELIVELWKLFELLTKGQV